MNELLTEKADNAATQVISKRRTISMDIKTWKRLASKGQFGDSWDSLINKLLDTLESAGLDIQKEVSN